MAKRLNTEVTVKTKKLAQVTQIEYPKYFRDIANKANRYSGATRKTKIGDLGVLFNRFKNKVSTSDLTVQNWRTYYTSIHPNAIEVASTEVANKFLEIIKVGNPYTKKLNKKIISLINFWVEDLIINKTFNGFVAQEQVIRAIAKTNDLKFTRSTSSEDSKGIDGFVGKTSISVKPSSYRPEVLEADKIVYYTITEGTIVTE